MDFDRQKNSGFSLIEICIVLIIAGLLTAAFARYADVSIKQKRAQDLKLNMAAVQDALATFENANGRLPCPAPRDAPITDPTFGKEVSCNGAAHSGTTVVNGRIESAVPLKVRIGTLPIRDMDISSDMMLDPWMRRITYAVTEANTANAAAAGGITVKDASGNSITSSPGIARYVLFSHGNDGAGGYSTEGKQFNACPAGGKEQENCDDKDATFIAMDRNDGEDPAQYYDDYLVYNVVATGSSGACKLYRVKAERSNLRYAFDTFSAAAAATHPWVRALGYSNFSTPSEVAYPTGTTISVFGPADSARFMALGDGMVIPTDGSFERVPIRSYVSRSRTEDIWNGGAPLVDAYSGRHPMTDVVCQNDGKWHSLGAPYSVPNPDDQ